MKVVKGHISLIVNYVSLNFRRRELKKEKILLLGMEKEKQGGDIR